MMRRFSKIVMIFGMCLMTAHVSAGNRIKKDVDLLSQFGEGEVAPVKVVPQADMSLSLESCVAIALANNGLISGYDYAIDAAMAKVSQAKAGGKPVFEYEYNTAPVPNDLNDSVLNFLKGDVSWLHRVKIGVGIPIYTFGKLETAENLAHQGVRAEEIKKDKERVKVVSRVRQLYYGVQFADALLDLLHNADNRIEKELAKTNRDIGDTEEERATGDEENDSTLSPIERIKLKLFKYDLEKRIFEADRRKEVAVDALRIQLGLQPGAKITMKDKDLKMIEGRLPTLSEYQEMMMANRQDLQLIATGIEAKNLELKLEEKKLLPDFGAGAFFEVGRTTSPIQNVTATDDFSDPFNFTRAGIGLRLKGKLDFHNVHFRTEQIRSEYLKATIEGEMAKEGLKLELKEAYLKARDAHDQVSRAEEAQTDARAMLFLSKSNLDLGIGEKDDYTDALQAVLLTKGRYLESIFNYNVAMVELEEKSGLWNESQKKEQ